MSRRDDLAAELLGAPRHPWTPLRMRGVVMLLFRSGGARRAHLGPRHPAARRPAGVHAGGGGGTAPAGAGVSTTGVELKWQRGTADVCDAGGREDKRYVLDMLPYPSGAGLHAGHRTHGRTSWRYWRMRDLTCSTMGWDGLGCRRAARDQRTHAVTTARTSPTSSGSSSRSASRTTGSAARDDRRGYVKWTQWIFVQLFKRNLPSSPRCRSTGARSSGRAREQEIDGLERGSFPVERRPLRQWVLKITEYAERLAEELDGLQWPEGTMRMQRAWDVDGRRASSRYRSPPTVRRRPPRLAAARRAARPALPGAQPPPARPPPAARRRPPPNCDARATAPCRWRRGDR